jgi:hypothetical protein
MDNVQNCGSYIDTAHLRATGLAAETCNRDLMGPSPWTKYAHMCLLANCFAYWAILKTGMLCPSEPEADFNMY